MTALQAEAYARALADVRAEILDVTMTWNGAEVIFADDVRQDLQALSLHNPFWGS